VCLERAKFAAEPPNSQVTLTTGSTLARDEN